MMGEDRLERVWCRGEGDVDHTYTATNEYRQLTKLILLSIIPSLSRCTHVSIKITNSNQGRFVRHLQGVDGIEDPPADTCTACGVHGVTVTTLAIITTATAAAAAC